MDESNSAVSSAYTRSVILELPMLIPGRTDMCSKIQSIATQKSVGDCYDASLPDTRRGLESAWQSGSYPNSIAQHSRQIYTQDLKKNKKKKEHIQTSCLYMFFFLFIWDITTWQWPGA